MDQIVNENYDWFKENLKELIKDYDDKYIVIKDKKILSSYDSYAQAYHDTITKEKIGTFIIQLCSLDEDKTIVKIYSPNIIILNGKSDNNETSS